MKWRQRHGVWNSGPFTVRVEVDPRTHVTCFELFDSTRFVQVFASAQEARNHAACMSQRPANDVQRRAAS